MKGKLTEGIVMFISVIKWFVLATAVGAIVGVSTSVFLKILNWSTSYGAQHSYYYLLLPLALFASSATIKYLAPDAEGHGTEKVIEAVHKYSGKIKASVVPVKLVATVITLAAGGSVGKEGPSAQIGAGLSSVFADLLKFNAVDHKKLVICGISAGFAAVFGTPIGGAIFGVEVLFVGSILYDVLLPSFIAGLTAYQVSSAMGIDYFYHSIELGPVLSETVLIKMVVAGIFFGAVSFFFIEIMNLFNRISKELRLWAPLKGIVGGLALIVLTLIFSGQYLGLGLNTIESSLNGETTIWYAFIMKAIFTSITLSFGGSGGVVTSIFFMGATSGTLFAQIFGLDVATFSAIGLVSVLAGAANAPVAASIIAVELFGPEIASFAAVACVISFLITGHRSIYPSQVLSIKKSASIQAEVGKEMQLINPQYQPRSNSVIGAGFSIAKKFKGKVARSQPKYEADEEV